MLPYVGGVGRVKAFARAIKLGILRWGNCSGLSEWALNTTITDRHTEEKAQRRRKQCDHSGRDLSDAATPRETLGPARRWKGTRTEPLPGASGESATLLTPRFQTSGLRNCRRWVSVAPPPPPRWCNLLLQRQEADPFPVTLFLMSFQNSRCL